MTTFIFEYSSPSFYKVVEYRSKKRTLKNIMDELRAWGTDTARYFNDNENKAQLTAYTYEEGRDRLEKYKAR